MKKQNQSDFSTFYKAVLSLQNEEECSAFFEDVCTIKELDAISQRLEVANLLSCGKNYQEVTALTGASTATISRVNKCLMYGNGGYKKAIEIIKNKKENGKETGKK